MKKVNQSSKNSYKRLLQRLLEARIRPTCDLSTCTEQAKQSAMVLFQTTLVTFSPKMEELIYNQAKQMKKVAMQIVFLIAKVKSLIMPALPNIDLKALKSKSKTWIKIFSKKTRPTEINNHTILNNSNHSGKENKKEI